MAKAQNKPLSRRVLVKINRDVTTSTSTLVWEHEIPLLEVVHGEGTVQVVQQPVAALDEGYIQRRGDIETVPPSRHLGLEDVFAGDPLTEYNRLASLYGMHDKVEVPIVEYVYGRFNEGKFVALVGGADLDDLSERQLKHTLEAAKVPVTPGTPVAELRKMVAAEQAA